MDEQIEKLTEIWGPESAVLVQRIPIVILNQY